MLQDIALWRQLAASGLEIWDCWWRSMTNAAAEAQPVLQDVALWRQLAASGLEIWDCWWRPVTNAAAEAQPALQDVALWRQLAGAHALGTARLRVTQCQHDILKVFRHFRHSACCRTLRCGASWQG